jgi:hypothetical protein
MRALQLAFTDYQVTKGYAFKGARIFAYGRLLRGRPGADLARNGDSGKANVTGRYGSADFYDRVPKLG